MPLSHSSSIFKKSLMYLLQNEDRKRPARLRGAEAAHGHLKPKQFSKTIIIIKKQSSKELDTGRKNWSLLSNRDLPAD
jgi:hypothetical protein